MAETTEKLPTVRQHADKLVKEMVDKGQIQADGDAAIAAAGIPSFSKGTATLDPNTGRPVPQPGAEVPAFADGAVQSPEQQTLPGTGGATPTAQEAKRLIDEHQARLADARAREQAAGTIADGAPPSTQAPAGAEAGAQAAEAAAAAQIEYDEFEFEDPDLDLKYPIRVPKQYAESAKRGYGRRAAADRAIRYAKEADPVLRPLIEDGRIQQILPLIQRALNDQAFGDYVYAGYQRATAGLPLIEQARQEAAAAPAQPPGTVPFDFAQDDPYFAERAAPLVSELRSVQQQVADFQRQQQEATRQQAEQARVNQQRNNEMAAAHRDLATAMPELYTGNLQRDQTVWQRTIDIAREAGYADAYGLRAGIYFAGQQLQAIERERLAATASPAAAMLNAQQNEHMELARRQAAESSRTVGAGAVTQAAPAPPPQRPSTMMPDGKGGMVMKPLDQFLSEQQAFLVATGALT